MKRFVIFSIIAVTCTLLTPQNSSAQSQQPVRYNDWMILTVAPATVENAISNYLATDEWAIERGFEFLGVYVNFAPAYHENAIGAMCVDRNGWVYAFIFDSSGELIQFYAMGYFW
jgi:hypothetical protein